MHVSAEKAFWLLLSNPKSEQLDVIQTPVEIEVPKELPKISLVKTSFQKLKNHLASFDKVVKVRTTPNAITEGSWGFKYTKKVFLEEVIPFLNSLRSSFKYFDNGLHSELNEKELSLDNGQLLDHIICQDVMNIVMHADSVSVNDNLSRQHTDNKCLVNDNLEIEKLEQENDHLFELLLSKHIVHICVNSLASCNECCEMQQSFIQGKNVVENDVQQNNPNVIALGIKSSTGASRSQPLGNTKKNRISQTTSSNHKNKVEDQPRSVKSNSNKKNRVIEPVCNANVKYTTLNAYSELIYVKCNQCMFDANHDVCFLEFVNDVNVRQTFTIDRNMWSLTRITSTKVVPLKKTTSKLAITQNLKVKVYSRRPKVTKSVGSSSKSKIVESNISNNSKPNQSWGSNAFDVPSSSLIDFRFENDQHKDNGLWRLSDRKCYDFLDDKLIEKEVKQMEAVDQAIQTILMGLLEDIYAAFDSYEIALEIWFTSIDGESIKSYYHHFSKLMNDFKRNKHFLEKIASNLKFLNNLQQE
ncbi:hypothetical protein Tco_1122160 [Tanacetum coccineum]|uniref:Uncharacterized protein n=1 Tax=Tanacetum coccineum TaxID=301880 RepID=A0ABQ5IZT4_9ASTR